MSFRCQRTRTCLLQPQNRILPFTKLCIPLNSVKAFFYLLLSDVLKQENLAENSKIAFLLARYNTDSTEARGTFRLKTRKQKTIFF